MTMTRPRLARGTMPCPIAVERGEDHGPMVPIRPEGDDPGGWRCPHAVHDGHPRTHPQGYLPASRSRFTTAEAEEARDRALAGA